MKQLNNYIIEKLKLNKDIKKQNVIESINDFINTFHLTLEKQKIHANGKEFIIKPDSTILLQTNKICIDNNLRQQTENNINNLLNKLEYDYSIDLTLKKNPFDNEFHINVMYGKDTVMMCGRAVISNKYINLSYHIDSDAEKVLCFALNYIMNEL